MLWLSVHSKHRGLWAAAGSAAGPRLDADSAAPSGVGRWRDRAGLGLQEQVPQHRDGQSPLLYCGLNQTVPVLPQLTIDGLQGDRMLRPEPSTS